MAEMESQSSHHSHHNHILHYAEYATITSAASDIQQQQQHSQQQLPTPMLQQQCQNCHLPVLKPDVLNSDRGLFKLYCFIKDFIG